MSIPLSSDLISQFAKATVGQEENKPDTALRGTVTRIEANIDEPDKGRVWVRIDGDQVELDGYHGTPVSRSTVAISDLSESDRVELTVKNHAVVITGNITNGSIGIKSKGNLETRIEQTEKDIKLTAENTAGLKTTFELTAKEIRSEVKGLNSTVTEISQTASDITQRIENAEGEFSELKQTVDEFTFTDEDGKVKIHGGNIDLTGAITFSDLDADAQGKITDAQNTADEALDTANKNKLPENITETYIDRMEIRSPTISGKEIIVEGTFQTRQEIVTPTEHGAVYSYVSTGYMGAATGSTEDGTTTYGVALANEWNPDTGNVSNSYVIVTNAGVRLQYSDNSVVVSQGGIWLNTSSGSGLYHNDTLIGSSSSLYSYPVGTMMLRLDTTSPASLIGGTWQRISQAAYLYATGSDAHVGTTDKAPIYTSGDDNALFLRVAVWRRTA